MSNDPRFLRRKWTLHCGERQVVLFRNSQEKTSHVLMKALIWGLYVSDYPDLVIERAIDDRYKPDVVELGDDGRPRFWGESGQVSPQKIHSLAKRYPETHLALAKWTSNLDPHALIVEKALKGVKRLAPFDLLGFADDSATRFIDEAGEIRVTLEDVEHRRWEASNT